MNGYKFTHQIYRYGEDFSFSKKEDDAIVWCTEQFGEGGRNQRCRWRYGWVHSADTFHFKHEADVTLFMLRWA